MPVVGPLLTQRDQFIADCFGLNLTGYDWWIGQYIPENPDAMKLAWKVCMTRWHFNPLRFKG